MQFGGGDEYVVFGVHTDTDDPLDMMKPSSQVDVSTAPQFSPSDVLKEPL